MFTRLVGRRGRDTKAGDIAGYLKSDGYVTICVDGKAYLAHRLAYLYMEGTWPPDMIDHKNNCPSNNIRTNLRPATNSENQLNSGAQKNNILGQKNIRKVDSSYQVTVQGAYVGGSTDLETAILWRDFAVKFCNGNFARIEEKLP